MTTESLTRGIDHLGLTVANLNVTRDFFVNCLGWQEVGAKPAYPAVIVSDGHILLTLWQLKDEANKVEFDRKKNVGLHHLALRAASAEAFATIFERVSAWPGVKVEFAPEDLGSGPKRHTMVYEPGGIRLEFDLDPHALTSWRTGDSGAIVGLVSIIGARRLWSLSPARRHISVRPTGPGSAVVPGPSPPVLIRWTLRLKPPCYAYSPTALTHYYSR